MTAASVPIQRPSRAKLLAVDANGSFDHRRRSEFVNLLRTGDIVIANDAGTLPASLSGRHAETGSPIEIRLAARASLDLNEIRKFSAVVFGAGNFRMRTEDRPPPPVLKAGDRLELGPLQACVAAVLNHPRLVRLEFDGPPRRIWEGLAQHGRPIQYSHVPTPLALWDTWTPIAGPPVAFEPPSAGFVLDWSMLSAMTARGIRFATLTHAAGISSTGDAALDALLPFDEPYRIPRSTAQLINSNPGARIIAIGTTVVRALEHAAIAEGVVEAGEGVANQKIGACTRLRIVQALLSGTHEPGTSHFELLRAFVDDETVLRMDKELNASGYLTHEFGDSVFIERSGEAPSSRIMSERCA